eukprot:Gb_10945 [translate_table: standard]
MERLLAHEYDHSNITKVIDMKRSGATIAYDFFAGKLLSVSASSEVAITQETLHKKASLVSEEDRERIGLLFKYVEDADLWTWNLPNSKAFSSGLKDMQIEFNFILNPDLFNQVFRFFPAWLKSGLEL